MTLFFVITIYKACLEVPGVEPVYSDWLTNEMQMFALYLPIQADAIGPAYSRLVNEFLIEVPITLLYDIVITKSNVT